MGVRMREYLAKMPGSGWKSGKSRINRESGGHETTIIGLKVVEAKLQQLAYWSERDYNNIVAINKKVVQIYVDVLKQQIEDFDQDIKVYEKTGGGFGRKRSPGNVREIVRKGQLKRSIGSWVPSKDEAKVIAGPRTNWLGRRKVAKKNDGWFAHIVEGGDQLGMKLQTDNTGVFKWSRQATMQRMATLRNSLLRVQYERYMK